MDIKWTISRCAPNCSSHVRIDLPAVMMTFTELYIPAITLDIGLYLLNINVTMKEKPIWNGGAVAYVQIDPAGITANLVPLGTSIITHDQTKELILDPGRYSVDPNSHAQIFHTEVSFTEPTSRSISTSLGLDLQILLSAR